MLSSVVTTLNFMVLASTVCPNSGSEQTRSDQTCGVLQISVVLQNASDMLNAADAWGVVDTWNTEIYGMLHIPRLL